MWQKLYNCPICQGTLSVNKKCEYYENHKIKSNGETSKQFTKSATYYTGETYLKCLCCDYVTNEQYESELYPEIKIEEDGDGFIFEDLKEKEE